MSQPEKNDPRSFVTNFLERSGAVQEETGYALVEALLSDELAVSFGEQILLAFDYEVARENPEAIFVTYGSPILDTMARLAARYGRYTVHYCPDLGFSQSRRFDREIAEKLEFLRCRRPQAVYQWLSDHVYWQFIFQAVYHSYDKMEELLPVVLDGHTGLAVPDFSTWWGTIVPAQERQYQLTTAESRPLKDLYAAACRVVGAKAEERARVFQLRSAQQRSAELDKIAVYYGQTIAEIKKKMATADGSDKKDRLQKQYLATQADWQRRKKDTLERYAMEVELYLDHLVACHLPLVHIKLELQHKDRLLNTTVLYNLLASRLELPVCPLCRKSAARLTPDRENRFVCIECS